MESESESELECNSIILPTYCSRGVSELHQQRNKTNPYNKRKANEGLYVFGSLPCCCDSLPLVHHVKIYFGPRKAKTPCHQNSMLCFQCATCFPLLQTVVVERWLCSKSKFHLVFQILAGTPFSQQCITNSDCDERLSVHSER